MMIFYSFGCLGHLDTLGRVQTWALDRLIAFNCASGDVRGAILLLALRLCCAMWVFGRRAVAWFIRNRTERGTRSAADATDAANTVAAGRS